MRGGGESIILLRQSTTVRWRPVRSPDIAQINRAGTLTPDADVLGSRAVPHPRRITSGRFMSNQGEVTALLQAAADGDRDAVDRLFAEVYAQLKELAHGQRRRWDGDYTLNTTALANEAYLKLIRQDQGGWQDRVHFMSVASTAMRHILVNYAERRTAQKRGSGATTISLEDSNPVAPQAAEEILDLHRALERLAEVAERPVKVVECRFFTGLTLGETASALGVSRATVERDWLMAVAWLRRELQVVPDRCRSG
jgi:RNA polymerase sigma factor (TIGR02999 family)